MYSSPQMAASGAYAVTAVLGLMFAWITAFVRYAVTTLRTPPRVMSFEWIVAVLTFEDGTMATIHSNDITLGGVRNVVTAYLTNAVIQANINPNTAVTAYAPDAAIWGDEYITEKVETKAGWQYPS